MSQTMQVVSFKLGSEEYGVDIAQVQEINRMVAVTHVPRAEHTKNTRIVVTEIGSQRVGMVVDSVSEVLRLPVDQVEPAPEMITGVDTEYIRGVGKIEDRLIILLDLGRIISGAEKRELEASDAEAAAAA